MISRQSPLRCTKTEFHNKLSISCPYPPRTTSSCCSIAAEARKTSGSSCNGLLRGLSPAYDRKIVSQSQRLITWSKCKCRGQTIAERHSAYYRSWFGRHESEERTSTNP